MRRHPILTRPSAYPLTLSVLFVTIVFYIFSLMLPRLPSLFGLSPGKIMQGHVWSLWTAHVLESSVAKLAFLLPLILMGVISMEVEWGTQRLAHYLVFVSTLSSLVCLLVSFVLYVMTLDEAWLFRPFHGLGGLGVSLVLALASRRDKSFLLRDTGVDVRYLILPTLILATLAVMTTETGERRIRDAGLAWASFWISLARLTTAADSETSEDYESWFGLHTLVPDALKPVAASVWRLVPLRRACAAGQAASDASSNAGLSNGGTARVPGLATDSVAERRRARAMLALDRKLAEMEAEKEVDLEEAAPPRSIGS